MKVILNQDVPNLGEEGDVCLVKDGYARNYLLPTGAAVIYSKENIALFKSRAAAIEKKKLEKREASATLKAQLDAVELKLAVAAGETGKLFGSVTQMMIQEELAKLGFEIEKKKIEVASHTIKTVGVYSAKIHLYENDFSTIKLEVVSNAPKKAEKAEKSEKAEKAEKAEKKVEEPAPAEPAAEEAPAEEVPATEAPAEEKAEN